MKLLEGKTALITGASRGIGKSIAQRFALEGANIALTNIADDDEFKATIREIESMGVKAKGYVSNAASFDDSQRVINEVVADFTRIDILVNNAGITRDTLLMRMTEDQWDSVIAVNLKSVFNLTKAVLQTMLKQKSGSIINMSFCCWCIRVMLVKVITLHQRQAYWDSQRVLQKKLVQETSDVMQLLRDLFLLK